MLRSSFLWINDKNRNYVHSHTTADCGRYGAPGVNNPTVNNPKVNNSTQRTERCVGPPRYTRAEPVPHIRQRKADVGHPRCEGYPTDVSTEES